MMLLFLVCVLFVTIASGEDPEINMDATEMIKYWGYPVINHQVTTKDGYILNIQRIPAGRYKNVSDTSPERPVAFVQHGLLSSSADWVANPWNESLPFLLADAGIDVWLGNSRGNDYSKQHTKLSVDSDDFWDFSWDEMAKYDLPACVDYVLEQTGKKQIYYIGHSQGTLIGFAGFSEDQKLASKIRTFFALAPVASVGHMLSPLKYLSYFTSEVSYLFDMLGVRDFMPSTKLTRWLADHMCEETETRVFCENIMFVLCGYDKQQLNMSRLDVYTTHFPAGTSVKDIIHFGQMYKSKKFQKYDYGEEGNKKHYGQVSPPQYDPTKMSVPVAIFSGGNDLLADPKDVSLLVSKLPRVVYHKKIGPWDHLDFLYGMDAPQMVYSNIIKLIRKQERRNASVN